MTPIFVDTNILLYAASSAPVERTKTLRARQLLTTIDVALSTQVLQEFYWIATRPHKLGLSHEEAQKLIDLWKLFRIQPITIGVVEDALALCARYQITYWDAAIVAAARHLGCELLYSEDLNSGQRYDGVLVANPFVDG
jgi:predicted nucleic acid-binding protein